MLSFNELSCLQGFWQLKNGKPHREWCCMDSILRRWNQSDFLVPIFSGREATVFDKGKSAFNKAKRVLIKE